MPKGNWNANPGPQSDAGNVDNDRGMDGSFDYMAPNRKTGKVGSGKMVPNEPNKSDVAPDGKPKL